MGAFGGLLADLTWIHYVAWGATVVLAYRYGKLKGFNTGTRHGRAATKALNEVVDRLHYEVDGEYVTLEPRDLAAALAEYEGVRKAKVKHTEEVNLDEHPE